MSKAWGVFRWVCVTMALACVGLAIANSAIGGKVLTTAAFAINAATWFVLSATPHINAKLGAK